MENTNDNTRQIMAGGKLHMNKPGFEADLMQQIFLFEKKKARKRQLVSYCVLVIGLTLFIFSMTFFFRNNTAALSAMTSSISSHDYLHKSGSTILSYLKYLPFALLAFMLKLYYYTREEII